MPNEDLEVLPLKNGSSAKARDGLAERMRLEELLRRHPDHFCVLLDLVKSPEADSPSDQADKRLASMQYLVRTGAIQKNGSIDPLLRDVLLSGYQLTPDGPVIAQPFLLSNEAEKRIVDAVQQNIEHDSQNWRTILQRRLGNDGGPAI